MYTALSVGKWQGNSHGAGKFGSKVIKRECRENRVGKGGKQENKNIWIKYQKENSSPKDKFNTDNII